MGLFRTFRWSSYLLLLSVSTIALLIVWFSRSIVRLCVPDEQDGPVWTADFYDVGAGVALFVLVALVGTVVMFANSRQPILLVSDVLYTNLPSHITPVQRWRPKPPPPPPPPVPPPQLPLHTPPVKVMVTVTRVVGEHAKRKRSVDPFAPLAFPFR